MSDTTATAPDATPVLPPVPPLEHGQRLTREEFERRYDAMPGLKKAELIEGVVQMPSPVRHRQHGRQHSHIPGWLFQYEVATPGTEGGAESSLRLDLGNEPQPDSRCPAGGEHSSTGSGNYTLRSE
jgi:hypothetical protein